MPQSQSNQAVLESSFLIGPTSFPLLEHTIGHHLDRMVQAYPNQLAVVVRHQDIYWTYQQLLQKVQSVALGLLELGIKPGDRVGIWSPNNIEWVLVQYATAYIGAVMVCVNPAYREYELEYALNLSECKALICSEQFHSINYISMLLGMVPEIEQCELGQLNSEKLPHLKWLVNIGTETHKGFLPFNQLYEEVSENKIQYLQQAALDLNCHDPINIQFTSGTTGNPKGATLTHHNILNNALVTAKGMNFTYQDKLCVPVPLYHCFGMTTGNLACMTVGACSVFPSESFEPLKTLEALDKEKCTAMHGVPTMFVAILAQKEFSQFDLSSMRTGAMAGAPCPESLMRSVVDKMHMTELLGGYGQTESSPLNHLTMTDTPLDKRVSTVGRAAEHTEIKIINDTGEVCGIGERGEICARGYCVMKGYWNEPEKTTEAIDSDGWLHSGDLGVMGEEGYVKVVGRIKDMIIKGGENVYPKEVEDHCLAHSAIEDASVFGIEDHYYGEEICVWVKLKQGVDIEHSELEQFLKNRIAHYKIPKHIKMVKEYPMTVTGKIQKFKMREIMEAELN